MDARLRLIIFDVDGTLVDSQGDIVAAMTAAFDAVGAPMPDRQTVLGVVGLSLDVIFPRLCPDLPVTAHHVMVAAYKDAYMDLRAKAGIAHSSPLYAGALESLKQLRESPEVLLGVATGKSRRGLDKLIEGHDLGGFFVTQQVADFHPSKPHPSMILQAMHDVGVDPEQTVMIGDTSFDMDMAAAAGVAGVGVSWGYHPTTALSGARQVIDTFSQLQPVLKDIWGQTA